jgi:hypothetical protein
VTDTTQNLIALAQANEVRYKRAALKKELFALPIPESRAKAAGIILDPPDYVETMAVFRLLTACYRTGPAHTRKYLRAVGISDQRAVGALTKREAEHLSLLLRTQADGRIAA